MNRLQKLNEFKSKLYALFDEYGFVDTVKINWRNPKDAEDNF